MATKATLMVVLWKTFIRQRYQAPTAASAEPRPARLHFQRSLFATGVLISSRTWVASFTSSVLKRKGRGAAHERRNRRCSALTSWSIGERPSSAALLCRLGRLAEVQGGAHQGQMRERLRKIAELTLLDRIVLLRQ